MTRIVEDIIAALQAFEPSADESDNVHRLNEICTGLQGTAPNAPAMAAIFALVERFPAAEFGTPGPLVHLLETLPGYDALLAGSLLRQPTDLTTWMANRLLNTSQPREERLAWLQRLTQVTTHPLAAPAVRESTIRFLDFQASRSGRARS